MNKDFEQAQKLMKSLSYIGTKEHPRSAMIREKLCDILEIDIYEESNVDENSDDGVHIFVVNNFRIPLLVIQLKEEFDEGASDPSAQVGHLMKRAWIQKAVSLTFYSFSIFNFNFIVYLEKGNTRKVLLSDLDASRWWSLAGCAWGRIH